MNSTTYKVTVSHPTNFHKGTHEITVTKNSDGRSKYASGGAFGCSRDYFVSDDKAVIRTFLAEHACTVVEVVKVRQPK